MITTREKDLITSLYDFYVGKSEIGGLKNGDEVIYNRSDSKYYNKKGIFLEIRSDGKYRIKMNGTIFIAASPQYVSKIKKDDSDSINRLIKILKQMVADGDLSQLAVDGFIRGLERDKKLKIIDPYDEENWEEDEESFIPRRMARPRIRRVEPERGGGGGYRSC